jgi:hypothetical protein
MAKVVGAGTNHDIASRADGAASVCRQDYKIGLCFYHGKVYRQRSIAAGYTLLLNTAYTV